MRATYKKIFAGFFILSTGLIGCGMEEADLSEPDIISSKLAGAQEMDAELVEQCPAHERPGSRTGLLRAFISQQIDADLGSRLFIDTDQAFSSSALCERNSLDANPSSNDQTGFGIIAPAEVNYVAAPMFTDHPGLADSTARPTQVGMVYMLAQDYEFYSHLLQNSSVSLPMVWEIAAHPDLASIWSGVGRCANLPTVVLEDTNRRVDLNCFARSVDEITVLPLGPEQGGQDTSLAGE